METLPKGYPKLAALQATYPQLGIYRRFATLNARNLLYLQAELVILESNLNEFTRRDCVSEDLTARLYNKNWYHLDKRKDGVLNSQYYTMLRVREKLKEYTGRSERGVVIDRYVDECLFQQRQLATFDLPESGNLEFLNDWLVDPRQGDCALEGLDRNVWKEKEDLVVIKPDGIAVDSFTRVLRKPLTAFWHKLRTRRCHRQADEESMIYAYDEKIVIRVADMIGTAIASLLPVLAVVVLYSVREMLARLGIIALFTVLFALALMITTKAKRVEIFAATAGFASVQVVFVGSTSS
ncbi:ATP synthase subunit gamma protein [Rutstroemia sp. NJR-2017a BVV2]|nr:ATP synthase subunit gamma protein [Rutstroemia sp. NJR-2017a BVV2]